MTAALTLTAVLAVLGTARACAYGLARLGDADALASSARAEAEDWPHLDTDAHAIGRVWRDLPDTGAASIVPLGSGRIAFEVTA